MTKFYIMEDDPELSKLIWGPSFKKTLEEKHGEKGAIGARGEDNAQKHLLNEELFPELDLVVKHEDAFHQYMGIDFTTKGKNGRTNFIDVKAGKTALYWTEEKGWYITLKKSWFDNENKKTDYFMHVGPKGDVFAIYKINDLLDWCTQNHTLLVKDEYGIILYKNVWPEGIIYTNL